MTLEGTSGMIAVGFVGPVRGTPCCVHKRIAGATWRDEKSSNQMMSAVTVVLSLIMRAPRRGSMCHGSRCVVD